LQERDVLLPDRFVGAELLPGQLEDRFRRPRRFHHPRRIARYQADGEEGDGDDAEHDDEHLCRPLKDVAPHR
jgi:hypothetical protein